MSLFGALRTSVSGMNAQSNKLGAVAQNVSNVGTTGYKRASTEFETVLGSSTVGDFASGSVLSVARSAVSEQGSLTKTSSGTDLAINGRGFFVVAGPSGATALTRAGAFTANAKGDLVNAGGYTLLGADLSASGGASANSTGNLVPINIDRTALKANPSKTGTLGVNLNADAAVVPAGTRPSDNTAASTATDKTSLVAYDDLGHKVTLDIYVAKTGANTWEETVYDASGATNGGFPYSAGPLATQSLGFDPSSGKIASGGTLSVAIPNGQAVTIDQSRTTQLAAAFTIGTATIDGNAPSAFQQVDIAADGTVSAVYADGTRTKLYAVPLATVTSPDRLTPINGDAFSQSNDSGTITLGTANMTLGAINAGTLESSTVDLGTELTSMIETQRSYTANSKVFQAGTDMLDMLMNLKV